MKLTKKYLFLDDKTIELIENMESKTDTTDVMSTILEFLDTFDDEEEQSSVLGFFDKNTLIGVAVLSETIDDYFEENNPIPEKLELFIEKSACWPMIGGILIDDRYQGKGYGKAIVEELKKEVRANDDKPVPLFASTNTIEADEFFQAIGFKSYYGEKLGWYYTIVE